GRWRGSGLRGSRPLSGPPDHPPFSLSNGAAALNSPRPARSSRLTPDLAFALDTLVRVVERQSREFRASILLLSDDRRHVLDAAAPSLPQAYRTAIDGLEVGPAAGSCGTAAHRESRVVVTDIERDPLWAEYRELARLYGLAACWSEPIRA